MLPLSYNSIDFLYDDFLTVYKKCDLYSQEYLTYDQVLERREKKLKKSLRRYTKGKYEIYKDRRSSGIQKQVGTRGYTLEKQCAQKRISEISFTINAGIQRCYLSGKMCILTTFDPRQR